MPTIGPSLTGGYASLVSTAKTGEPPACGTVDGGLPYRAREPEGLDHGHPANFRHYGLPGVHADGVGTVIGAEALLVAAAFEAGESLDAGRLLRAVVNAGL